MNNKDKTIQACRDTAAKYRNPKGKTFFQFKSCPLCKIHNRISNDIGLITTCKGCPLVNENGGPGCHKFKSYRVALDAVIKIVERKDYKLTNFPLKSLLEFNARAEFFDKIIPILQKIPSHQFTADLGTYFKVLNRTW